MIGRDKLAELLLPLLGSGGADGIEAVVISFDGGLTRFANNTIHQNVATENAEISFRVDKGGRIGVAGTNDLTADGLRSCLDGALQIADLLPPTPDWPGLPDPQAVEPLDTFDDSLAALDPAGRADRVKEAIAVASGAGQVTAGALKTGITEVAVFNSKGVQQYQPLTAASLTIVTQDGDGSGYSSDASRRLEDIDMRSSAEKASRKAASSKNPRGLEPGTYDVLLEEEAVAGAVEWLNYIGFGSRSFEEQTSFLVDRQNEQIAGRQISICDDGRHKGTMPMPFDFEGMPKRRVALIEKGVAGGPVHCTLSAVRAGAAGTGHALPPEEMSEGALPLNLVIDAGPDDPAGMLKHLERGILVTRFHYINGYLDTRNAMLTGLTRDGTFWVENGEIQYPLKQLRFTQNFLQAFSNVSALGSARSTITSWWGDLGAILAPSMVIRGFNITGMTG